jgi:hypothetical protein
MIKNFKEYLVESESKYNNFFCFIQKVFTKEWVDSINEALENVPESAIPTVICNFSNIKQITKRADLFNKYSVNNYGLTLNQNSIYLQIEYMSEDILNFYKEKGLYNERLFELKKDFILTDYMINESINVVAFNVNKYKKLVDITNRKQEIDLIYTNKNDHNYFFNKDGKLTIYHEFGHVYNNKKLISDKSEWKILCDKWYIEKEIDILKNYNEAFSEAFADYFGNNGEKLPDYINTFLKNNIY